MWLYTLQHMTGSYQAWTGSETDGPKHVVFGGSALQAFWVSFYSHGQVFWGQITDWAGVS